MNIIAVNVLWSLGLTAALTWRSSLLRITENRPAWLTYLQWTLALAIFKQLMALFFYTAQTAEIAEIFYILVVFPTGIFFPVAFETVLRFVERPSGHSRKIGCLRYRFDRYPRLFLGDRRNGSSKADRR